MTFLVYRWFLNAYYPERYQDDEAEKVWKYAHSAFAFRFMLLACVLYCLPTVLAARTLPVRNMATSLSLTCSSACRAVVCRSVSPFVLIDLDDMPFD